MRAPVTCNPPLTDPYKGGSKKYQIEKAILSGEVDSERLMRENCVTINTVYNVVVELAKVGYVLAIHQTRRKLPPVSGSSHPVSGTHQGDVYSS